MSATATRQVVTDELQADFREAFTLFDRQGDGEAALAATTAAAPAGAAAVAAAAAASGNRQPSS